MANRAYKSDWDYYSHGSHAYDVATVPLSTPQVVVPKPKRAVRPKRQAVEEVIVKKGISLYTIAIIGIVFACAFAAVYFGAEVQYNNRQARLVRQEIVETQRQISTTRSVINSSFNLAEVEALAERFGLARPEPHQQIRVYIPR